jgi:hypothetical protein
MSEADVGDPIWLDRDLLEALHDRSIERHGGLPGIRDEGALLSAIARPQNKFAYGESDLSFSQQPMASAWREAMPSRTATSASQRLRRFSF